MNTIPAFNERLPVPENLDVPVRERMRQRGVYEHPMENALMTRLLADDAEFISTRCTQREALTNSGASKVFNQSGNWWPMWLFPIGAGFASFFLWIVVTSFAPIIQVHVIFGILAAISMTVAYFLGRSFAWKRSYVKVGIDVCEKMFVDVDFPSHLMENRIDRLDDGGFLFYIPAPEECKNECKDPVGCPHPIPMIYERDLIEKMFPAPAAHIEKFVMAHNEGRKYERVGYVLPQLETDELEEQRRKKRLASAGIAIGLAVVGMLGMVYAGGESDREAAAAWDAASAELNAAKERGEVIELELPEDAEDATDDAHDSAQDATEQGPEDGENDGDAQNVDSVEE